MLETTVTIFFHYNSININGRYLIVLKLFYTELHVHVIGIIVSTIISIILSIVIIDAHRNDGQSFDMNQQDVDVFAKTEELKKSFHALVFLIITSIKTNTTKLKLMIRFYFQYARQNTSVEMQELLEKLQHSANTVEEIIMILINRNILGYLNFGILNDLKKFEAFDDEKVMQEIDEYKRKHNAFIRFNFSSIIRAFKERPNLAPPSLIGLPEITVELKDEWKGKSFYSWNEILQDFTNWPDHLLIKNIDTNCVIIVYYVMPFFLAHIVADLDNGAIVKKFAAVGAILHISLETLRLGREEGEWIKNRVEHAMAVVKLSTPAQLQGGACNKKVH